MKYSKWILAGLFGVLLQGTASAQIYESEDAEGVTEFSDTPSVGAEVVDLPATNIVEAPAPEPAEAPEQAPAPERAAFPNDGGEQGQEEGTDGVIYYGGGEDENVREQRREDAARINNALPGEGGVGVLPGRGAGEPGVGVAEPEAGREVAEPRAVHHEGGVHR